MSAENEHINVRGMTIIPSLSLNKHINAVDNYSLQDAIDMRMSNDRTRLENIENIANNYVITSAISSIIPNYSILDICSCKNEIVIFVKNNDIISPLNGGEANVALFRYNEKNNNIYCAYKYISYYEGQFAFDYTYNVNGDLILAFCEYDSQNNIKVPLRTINLNIQNYQNADIDLPEDKLTVKPGIKLSNFTNVYFQSGAGYTGWHYIYIQYKINEGRYTEWYRIGSPIKLLEETHNYLFSNKCIKPNGGTDDVKHGAKYVLNTGYINKTYNFEFNIDDSFYQYRIGVIVSNNTTRKYFVTEFIECNSDKASFIFNTNQLREEEFSIEQRINYYNVKNILNYKNELYISNYEVCDFGNINTDSIDLKLNVIDKSNVIIPETIIDRITVGNATVYQGAFNFDKNILWLLLSIHIERPYLNILNSLNNIQNDLIYIRKLDYDFNNNVAIKNNTEYCCRIEDVYYEYRECDLSFVGYNDNPPVHYTYLIIKGKDINGNEFTLTPFPGDNFINSVNFSYYIANELYSGIIQFRTASGNTSSNIICCYTDGKGQYRDSSINYVMFAFAKYIYYYEDIDWAWHVTLDNIDLWNNEDVNTKIVSAPDWYPIKSFNQLYTSYPSYFTIESHQSYTEQKQYYFTTLPANEIFDFYIHFINKYGELSDGYRLKNINGLIYKNNVPYVSIIYNINHNVNCYLVPANIQIKYINLAATPVYKVNSSNPDLIIETYTSISDCPAVLKNYLQNVEFKDLYFNTLANWNFYDYFIPYYNGKTLLFKSYKNPASDSSCIGCVISGVSLPENAIGYFISHNKIEFSTNNVGIRIDNVSYMQYYSILNDILDYKTFNNFYDDVQISPVIKPFSGDMINKTVPNDFRPVYKKIFDLEIAYAGENKFGRRNKSTILTQASVLGSPTMAFVNADTSTNGYITVLFNINNDFYLNEPTLYKFSNYFYGTANNQIIDGNLLGEYYDLLHIIYNELGVSYYYKVDDQESDTGHINLSIEDLENSKYETFSNILPVALVGTKFISLHSFNIETKNNPFQIGKKIFISPINTLNYFGQFIKECWEYDDYIFQKYDENKKKNNYDNTILFSNVINDETEIIKWNEFLNESYKFISENKGAITNMFTLGNNIFIHCTNALYILAFKDYLATTEESLQITQSSIKDISYKEVLPTDKGYCGLQDKKAAIVGNFGYIFYENDTNRLFRFDNGRLIYLDYPIIQWLKKYKPYKVRFANDVKHNNLYIQFNYYIYNNNGRTNKTKIYIYDYEINSFISRIDNYNFDISTNTKNEVYFVSNRKKNIDLIEYENKRQNKFIIPIIQKDGNVIDGVCTNKLSFVFNAEYDAIKFIEFLEWNLYKYVNGTSTEEYEPIEHHKQIYTGDYLRIYNDVIDTGWIDIKLNNIAGNKDEYNKKDNIYKPYKYLGKYAMNLFRNIKNQTHNNYFDSPTSKDYVNADDRSRLYGKWFVIEFAFNTSEYNPNESKIEFENMKIQVSQQTQIV